MHVIVVAEKGKNSTSDLNPIQMQYLDENSTDWRSKYFEFQKGKRKFFNENHNSYSKHSSIIILIITNTLLVIFSSIIKYQGFRLTI